MIPGAVKSPTKIIKTPNPGLTTHKKQNTGGAQAKVAGTEPLSSSVPQAFETINLGNDIKPGETQNFASDSRRVSITSESSNFAQINIDGKADGINISFNGTQFDVGKFVSQSLGDKPLTPDTKFSIAIDGVPNSLMVSVEGKQTTVQVSGPLSNVSVDLPVDLARNNSKGNDHLCPPGGPIDNPTPVEPDFPIVSPIIIPDEQAPPPVISPGDSDMNLDITPVEGGDDIASGPAFQTRNLADDFNPGETTNLSGRDTNLSVTTGQDSADIQIEGPATGVRLNINGGVFNVGDYIASQTGGEPQTLVTAGVPNGYTITSDGNQTSIEIGGPLSEVSLDTPLDIRPTE